jgi:hypothetical protein
VIKKLIAAIGIFLSLYILASILASIFFPYPKYVVHKTMNFGSSNVVIVSIRAFQRSDMHRELYADIWSDSNKLESYYLCNLDCVEDYYDRIRNITIIPDTGVLKVEFNYATSSKSGDGVDIYKLPEVAENNDGKQR